MPTCGTSSSKRSPLGRRHRRNIDFQIHDVAPPVTADADMLTVVFQNPRHRHLIHDSEYIAWRAGQPMPEQRSGPADLAPA